jgi:predicted RNase H-like HicB family nuclease
MQEYTVIIEKGEDGYLLSEVIELPGGHTQAKSMDELIKRTKEAITLYIKCQEKPIKITERFIGLQKIAV